MNEHRGALLTVGTALISVGGASWFAYFIAQSALSPKQAERYGFVPFVAECVALVGLWILAWWVNSYLNHQNRKRELDALVGRGIDILADLHWGAQLDGSQIDNMQRRTVRWIRVTGRWLERNLPDYRSHFLNLTGHSMLEGMFGNDDLNRMRTRMDVLLARLGEIQMKM